MTQSKKELLYAELSYDVRGCAMEVRKNYGPGHKETIYQNAFAEELSLKKISFKREESIKVFSPKTDKLIGSYQPDFLIDEKIIVELKALEFIPKQMFDRFYDYLRNSEYELGFLRNFGARKLYIKRIIYSNNRKPWYKRKYKTL